MKLESKISLMIMFAFLIIGAFFFMTGFSLLHLLSSFFEINTFVTYILFPLLLISIIIVVGLIINRQIRQPLLFFIRWIDQLSLGILKMPDTTKGFSFKKMGINSFLELKAKLDRLTAQLQMAEKERQTLDETRRNWAAGVTHDLKTPLSYIKGYAAMLHSEHTWNEEEVKEFARIIEDKSLYMEQLIHDLSIVYEFEKMQIPINLQTTNLVHFIKDFLKDIRQYPVVQHYSLYLTVDDEDETLLTFDHTLLRRALENFIMNAIDHNPHGTTITISIKETQSTTTIEVKDDGIGMEEQMVQQLFNQYYRGTTTDKPHLGSGLGMSIAKQFIEKQGGQIQVKSSPDQGTSIKIIFSH